MGPAGLAREVRTKWGLDAVGAAVGVAFGGLQAVHVAGHGPVKAERLSRGFLGVLHGGLPERQAAQHAEADSPALKA
ncbi:hypothetical protein GA0074695_4071 [Micromonospora viridifaciens]|uniref:Uncharacterized protein n=1 Tax=Micromonospora viridifaciens TaxID=1881 RepID=A0A1C4YBL1_MICVI|nr:hypothetical protein [Micromonospora viridifaciens]SCF18117.1 hypothetical protein GA0074695_4071 [Micromonospora viridifaciens]